MKLEVLFPTVQSVCPITPVWGFAPVSRGSSTSFCPPPIKRPDVMSSSSPPVTLVCRCPQRQERFSDCSALLELERKVTLPWRWRCRSFFCLTTSSQLTVDALLSSQLPPLFLTCSHPSFSGLPPVLCPTSPLFPPPPSPARVA